MLTREHFAPALDTSFDAEIGDTVVPLTLIELMPLGPAPHPDLRAPFSLMFRAPPGVSVPQDCYRLHHAAIGTLDIFVVPIRMEDEGLLLQSIFN